MDNHESHPKTFARPDASSSGSVRAGMMAAPVRAYEERLNRDPRWALSEGSRHFEENSVVFQALHAIADRLNALGIPYAVVGGMGCSATASAVSRKT